MVALCGEFPADQLTRLIPSPSYGEKLITELKAQKLLRTHYRDHLRGYRLTGRAKQMLLAQNPERFRDFLTGNTETNQVRSEVTRRLRLIGQPVKKRSSVNVWIFKRICITSDQSGYLRLL